MHRSITIMICAALAGCGATSPRDRAIARGAVEVTARAVAIADGTCARIGRELRDEDLLRSCIEHYDAARTALLTAGAAVDTWDRYDRTRSLPCALRQAIDALDSIRDELARRHVSLPSIVEDARTLAFAVGECHYD
jgi:hypothetical protein